MVRWIGLVGLALWLGGTATLWAARSWGVIAEPVLLELGDGTPIHGTVYRPKVSESKLPIVVVIHGTALARQSCAPGIAIPLAQNGYLTLAIDVRGHGESGGAAPRHELAFPMETIATLAEHPEVDAAIEYLKKHPLYIRKHPMAVVTSPCIALVGHSRGGWMAANVGYTRDDVDSVVSIGVAPGPCDELRPHNFLILTGGQEELSPPSKCAEVIAQATGGLIHTPATDFGWFLQKDARRLLVVSGVNHCRELADPSITRRVVQWVGQSLFMVTGEVSGTWLIVVLTAVLTACAGAMALCAAVSSLLARRILGPSSGMVRSKSYLPLGLFFILAGVMVPLVAFFASRLEAGPVFFAGPSIAVLTGLALCGLLSSRAARRTSASDPESRSSWSVGAPLTLGVLSILMAMVLFGIPWGLSWMGLVPTGKRLLVGAILFPLLFPGSVGLAFSWGRLSRFSERPYWAAASRVAIGIVLVGIVWFSYLMFATQRAPLFMIPVGFLSGSILVSLPLWSIADRPGMTLARSVCLAGVTSWFLACHLPFVEG